jgi:hypothetical protein
VIRPVDPSLVPDAAPKTQATSPAKPADASFAAQLRQAKRVVPPAGETWKPVQGHDDYVEIVDGPRKGQFVDVAKGPHRGETFKIEQHDGTTVRVYGEADKQQVVDEPKPAAHAKKPHSASETKPPKGELWAPVEGHWNYADILNGKRNGFFVNLSSGARRGMTFVIEHHGGKTYHVYGEGKDRQMIEVRTKPQPKTGSTPGA